MSSLFRRRSKHSFLHAPSSLERLQSSSPWVGSFLTWTLTDAHLALIFCLLRRLIQKYFDEISQDTGKYCYGVDDTLRGLELGSVETLIVWENLDVTRHILRDSNGAEIIVHTHAPPPTASNAKVDGPQAGINALSEKDREKFIDKITGLEMEQAGEPMNLLEWFSEKYKDFGAELEFVTNRSQEGSQFVKGFGGIGGILRYKVDFAQIADAFEVCHCFALSCLLYH